MSRNRSDHPLDHYHTRTLACLASSIALVLCTVWFWPAPDDATEPATIPRLEREVIQIEEVLQTRQIESAPPPPTPPVPLLVPDEIVLEEEVLEFADGTLPIEEPADGTLPQDGPDAAAQMPSGPTVGPKTVRFVEPEYTREARRHRVRAELVVRVLVNEKGRVTEAEIVERFLLGKDGDSKTPVAKLGYGLEEAALTAADRWMFRPARKNGVPIASQTTLTFTFGIDA